MHTLRNYDDELEIETSQQFGEPPKYFALYTTSTEWHDTKLLIRACRVVLSTLLLFEYKVITRWQETVHGWICSWSSQAYKSYADSMFFIVELRKWKSCN